MLLLCVLTEEVISKESKSKEKWLIAIRHEKWKLKVLKPIATNIGLDVKTCQ